MMFPDTMTDVLGLLVLGGVCLFEYLSAKKAKA
jgi:hypothetical protein